MNEQALTPQPSPVPNPTPAKAPRRSHRLRNALIGSVAALALAAGGTAAWALDRFVIDHVEVSDVAAYEAEHSTTASASASGGASSQTDANSTASESSETVTSLTDTSYASSDGTSVTITRGSYGSGSDAATYYVADVVVSDATDLRSAFAGNAFGGNITDLVSTIATQNNAVLAINGDYYGFRDTGIVIRNGVIYRDEDGTMEVYDETTTDAQSLVDQGVWQTLSFGPALVEDSRAVDGIDSVEIDTNFGNHSIQGDQPRTAIGIIDDKHFVFVVVDGRSSTSAGVTMSELAQIMVDLGATTAYNLDGGGSSEMWFNGEVVNSPSNGGERATSDILYIGSAQ
ncbi:phosphodiester glycosidase family protein [Schaalia hyovaginalis]|uniref:phosphodiester glycosidase family protein n=1 Tax=Schaalia hyovaginalis TaxID=29316 RepID=UPI001F4621C1|nr:phosphodiester glycosidase family protein [Schaalia hyovaginalis]MCF2711920.1 phosphodiester glycosidase family protein [Schaalia hyovaginalis]